MEEGGLVLSIVGTIAMLCWAGGALLIVWLVLRGGIHGEKKRKWKRKG